MENLNFKELEKPFTNSIISAMQLTYELSALHSYSPKNLHLDLKDFISQQEKFEDFILNLNSFIKNKKISTNIVNEIQEQVDKIDKNALLQQYAKYENLLSTEEYNSLRKHILNLEAQLDSFSLAYFKTKEEQCTIYENKTIQSLRYTDLIRGASNLVGAYMMWDSEMHSQSKSRENSISR